MDFIGIIGLVATFIVAGLAAIFTGNTILAYLEFPAFMLVIIGSFAAILFAYPFSKLKQAFVAFGLCFRNLKFDAQGTVNELIFLSEIARREGLLALDNRLEDLKDPFLKSGMQLVVDGADANSIKSILENKIYGIEKRHEEIQSVFDTWSKISPAFGLVGTLTAMITLLGKLSDRAAVAPALAVALVATLYGVMLSNFIMTPVTERLRSYTAQEILLKEMILDGILSVQSGDNPKILEEKVLTFLANNKAKKIRKRK